MIQSFRQSLPSESGYYLVYSWQDDDWQKLWIELSDGRKRDGFPPLLLLPYKYGAYISIVDFCCGGIDPWSIHWTSDDEDLCGHKYPDPKPEYLT